MTEAITDGMLDRAATVLVRLEVGHTEDFDVAAFMALDERSQAHYRDEARQILEAALAGEGI